ncbi:hypothetical protein, partial [Phormidium sp. CCY1219]|uniref:hypothetical protein n=1 Tax=Phormidium sp. CCY1219 TaxID=2886104 RepID=UPI002D1F2715
NENLIFPTENSVGNTVFAGNTFPFFATDTAEAVFGTTVDNFLLGMGGNDNLYAGTGNDILHGNTGNDYL